MTHGAHENRTGRVGSGVGAQIPGEALMSTVIDGSGGVMPV